MTVLATITHRPNSFLAVETAYDPAVVAQFKEMPGCYWDRATKQWCGPVEAVVLVLEKLERAGVIVTRPYQLPYPIAQGLPFPEIDNAPIYDYQKAGSRFLVGNAVELEGALLCDDMGLGKSAQTLFALSQLDRGWNLILCPAVVSANWARECEKWLQCGALRLDITNKKARLQRIEQWNNDGGIAVCSYDTFRSIMFDLVRANVIVLDELHYLANSKAARSKTVRHYIEVSTPRPTVIGLTGTPITARPRDMWHPLDLVYPGRFGNFFKFSKRYAGATQKEIPGLPSPVWDFSGASNLDELGTRLQKGGLMLRRVKGEVLELPERQRIMLPVELPERARKALMRASEFATGDSLSRALSAIEEHKLSAAIDLVKDLRDAGKKVLVFTLRKESARYLGEQLEAPYVTGEDAAEEREKILTASDVGIATVYSVTTGINLTHFDTAVFVGLDWVPSTLLQAEARIHRIGSNRPVTIYFLIGMQTVDEVVRSRVIERLEAFETVVGNAPDEAALAGTLAGSTSDEDLLAELVNMALEAA